MTRTSGQGNWEKLYETPCETWSAKYLPGKWALINSSSFLASWTWAWLHKEALAKSCVRWRWSPWVKGTQRGEAKLPRRSNTTSDQNSCNKREQREMPAAMVKSQRLGSDQRNELPLSNSCVFVFCPSCNETGVYLSVWSRIKGYQMFCLIQMSKMAAVKGSLIQWGKGQNGPGLGCRSQSPPPTITTQR